MTTCDQTRSSFLWEISGGFVGVYVSVQLEANFSQASARTGMVRTVLLVVLR